jgi:hypothetical protein
MLQGRMKIDPKTTLGALQKAASDNLRKQKDTVKKAVSDMPNLLASEKLVLQLARQLASVKALKKQQSIQINLDLALSFPPIMQKTLQKTANVIKNLGKDTHEHGTRS